MKPWKLFILLGITIVLTGCVSLKTPNNKSLSFHPISWKKRQAAVYKQRRFIAKGAFSIAEKGRKPVFANYQWAQNNIGYYRIRVSSALNLFNITILGRPQSVTLWKGTKKQITASTPERLIKREMGWTLPVRNLFYWIRGVAAPGQKQITTDQYGHLMSLKQNGWSIQFSHYTTVGPFDLPEKIVLQRPTVMITIVVKRWVLN